MIKYNKIKNFYTNDDIIKKMIIEHNIDDIININCPCDKLGYIPIKKNPIVKSKKNKKNKKINKKNKMIIILYVIILFMLLLVIKNNIIRNENVLFFQKLKILTKVLYLKKYFLSLIKKYKTKIFQISN